MLIISKLTNFLTHSSASNQYELVMNSDIFTFNIQAF